jgi:membrane protease YdiL (CAAX protease family)
MFFGWIYHRSHNLYLTWLTHFAADVVAALVLLT